MSFDITIYEQCAEALSEKQDIGVDVREDASLLSSYRTVKDARSDARAIERLFWRNEGSDTSRSSWQTVSSEVQTLLNEHTCDIDLLAWLCESWLRLDGYRGVSHAFDLLQKSLEKFGDTPYPTLDEDESVEWKVMALTGLNGEDADGSLIAPLTNVPLSSDGQVCLWHYRRAVAFEQITDQEERERQLSQGIIPLDELTQAIQETGKESLVYQLHTIEEALAKFESLEVELNTVFGHDAPPTSRIKDTLSECIEQCRYLIIAVFGDDVCVTEAMEVSGSEQEQSHHLALGGSIESRQQALQTLLSVGHYFKQSEPQSPIPYMLERIVSWANLSWPDLIARVVQNPSEMEHIFNLTGIHMQEEVVSEV